MQAYSIRSYAAVVERTRLHLAYCAGDFYQYCWLSPVKCYNVSYAALSWRDGSTTGWLPEDLHKCQCTNTWQLDHDEPCTVIVVLYEQLRIRWSTVSSHEWYSRHRGDTGRWWILFFTRLVANAYSWACSHNKSLSFLVIDTAMPLKLVVTLSGYFMHKLPMEWFRKVKLQMVCMDTPYNQHQQTPCSCTNCNKGSGDDDRYTLRLHSSPTIASSTESKPLPST